MRLGRGLVLLIPIASALAASANQQNGLVLGIVGKWNDRGKPIHFGSQLNSESKIGCESGSLTIWFDDVKKPVPIPCKDPGKAVSLAALHPLESGVFSKLWQLVTPRISQEPRSYIAAVSRGFGNPELEESVSELHGRQADLSPALSAAPAGQYRLALLPVTEDLPDAPPVTVNWKPGQASRVIVPEGAAGLWKVAMVAEDGTLSSSAWVLIATPERFSSASLRFQEARTLVKDWPGGTRAQASRTVLRAFLESMSH